MLLSRLLIISTSVFLSALPLLSSAATNHLTLTGSSTVAPLVAEIAKRFERQNPGIRIDVQTGGSTRGIIDTRTGLADIGMVSRDLNMHEADLAPFTIARDGIGIILHRKNPVARLSEKQIIAIYTGQVTNWQQVGGKNAPITVVNKAEGRSTLELFLHHFHLKNSAIKPQVIIGDNQQGIKTVAGNPNAIGYVSIGAAEFEAMHGTPIKLLPMAGIEATASNVRNGHFPLARPLNLVSKGSSSPLAQRFIRFAQSNQIDDLINQQYFVPPAR
jgi:phosphate transport system substrate-binding protein